MKLFDLLKSLNSGAAADPDAGAAHDSDARCRDRALLLDELHALLHLLDVPAPKPGAEPVPAPAPSQELLNLAAIFEGTGCEVSEDAVEPQPAFSKTLWRRQPPGPEPLPHTHKQLVRALLDDLLPLLEKAVGERLERLDDNTLEQWQQALAPPPSR